jgi:hypothetical protein
MDEDIHPTGGGGTAAGLSARAPFIVAAALVAGIGLYLVIHHSPSASVQGAARSTVTVTTPTSSGASPVGGLPVSSLRLIVVNGAGTSPAAAAKIATLRRLGYPIVDSVAGAATTGTTVQCKTGLSAQASTLAKALGPGAVVKAFPNPAPPIAPLLECLVTIGK